MIQDIEVRRDCGLYGPMSNESSREQATTSFVLLPSTNDEEKTVVFTRIRM